MTDEIIQIEHETFDQKIKEERKANGRLVAVIVALFLLFLAIYHAWIRKIAVLAGVLIPALIMILYGGWVVFLAKRDKQRRILLARQLEENARREISESKSTICNITKENLVTTTTPSTSNSTVNSTATSINKKHNNRRRKNKNNIAKTSSHIAKKWKDKKPSFRQRIFGRNTQIETIIKHRKDVNNPLCRSFSM